MSSADTLSQRPAATPASAPVEDKPVASASETTSDAPVNKTAPKSKYGRRNQWIAKLFTREDPKWFHKVFGFLAVSSFVYRYGVVMPKFGHLGFTPGEVGAVASWFNWLTIFVHVLLSSSSLIFHVLPKRIRRKPLIIYEEYRLHAIVFTMRACFNFFWHAGIRDMFGIELGSTVDHFMLTALILGHHVIVDMITSRYGSQGITAVRNANKSKRPFMVAIRRFYSFYQIAALACQLVPHARGGDIGWNALIAVQSSAFLMTLHRKGLVAWYTHAVGYTACLILSLYYFWMCLHSLPLLAGAVSVFVLRTYGNNKYVLWVSYAAFVYALRG
jgi:hypothetical protein